jgi:hypothetical protein
MDESQKSPSSHLFRQSNWDGYKTTSFGNGIQYYAFRHPSRGEELRDLRLFSAVCIFRVVFIRR